MGAHGGGCPVGVRAKVMPKAAGLRDVPHHVPQGFRHFLGTPTRRFKVDGEDPRRCPTARATLQRRMDSLAWVMEIRDGLRPPTRKPALPSGYTYLAQLLSHDMVSTTLPFWAVADDAQTRNERATPLRLETLYGGGPGGCPFLYAPAGRDTPDRIRFRLGPMGSLPQAGAAYAPGAYRDIARIATHFTSDALDPQGAALRADALTEPLVADSRNDDHAIISQLTALFQILHNTLVGLLPQPPSGADVGARMRWSERAFSCAQAATTLIYRHVLREDLLPRLLHPEVLRHYEANDGFLDDPAAPGMPLEFVLGAFRFGHSMVRDGYRFADGAERDLRNVLNQNSTRRPQRMPPSAEWIIRWADFFDIGTGGAANRARPIGPFVSSLLDENLPAIDEIHEGGLAYRDMMSAGLAGLWSVGALSEALRAHPQAGGMVLGLRGAAQARELVRSWFDQVLARLPGGRVRPEDAAALIEDPPLPFYVLLEAAAETDHAGLGRLGSIIVADTVFGAMAHDRLPAEHINGDLRKRLAWISRRHFDEDRFSALREIGSMSDVVRLIAEQPYWAEAVPPFA